MRGVDETAPARRTRLPAGEAPEIILETRALARSFEGVRAVDSVSIAVERGRLTGLIGPNGAGKSTLLGLLAGTLEPSEGSVVYRGEGGPGLPAHRRAACGAAAELPAVASPDSR